MSKRDEQLVLGLVGLGLIAVGHKLVDREAGRLGVPHLVGALLVAAATRV